MSDSQSRPDWFRLNSPNQSRTLGNDSATASRAGTQPIPQPPNHDGMDLAELPPMVEAELSADQVEALFADISALGKDVLLMQRSSSAARANARRANSSEELAIAQNAILSGEIERVQIRYRWQAKQWIDTLHAQGNAYRLVRIAHQNCAN